MSEPQNIYTPKVVYDCDGVRFEFPVPFEVDRDADIYAFTEKTSDGSLPSFIRNQDWRIRQEANGSRTVVTRVDSRRPPIPAGYRITIQLKMPFFQPTTKAQVSPRVFANRVDSLTRIYRQLREKLDRTLHIGLGYPPFFKTSEPYPVFSDDKLAIGISAKNSPGLFRLIADAFSVAAIPSGGTLFITLKQYLLWPIEKISVIAIPSGGENRFALQQYLLWPTEKLSVTAIPSGGSNRAALLVYSNYAVEKLSVTAIPTGGSLS